MWIDTHTHLNDPRFPADPDAAAGPAPAQLENGLEPSPPVLSLDGETFREKTMAITDPATSSSRKKSERLSLAQVLANAVGAGVEAMLVVGIDGPSSRRALELARQHQSLYAVVGVQPNSLDQDRERDWLDILEWAADPRVVALGETGLDRYWNAAPIETQREWFMRHLELARRVNKPVVIHCRDAEADVVETLRDFAAKWGGPIRGVMHSFTGDLATAQAVLDLGLSISFAGMVTFKKSDALRSVAQAVPMERLLIETDCPYLSPEPVRGRMNQPANVVHTGTCLAKVKKVSIDDFARATTANAQRLFRLPGETRETIE